MNGSCRGSRTWLCRAVAAVVVVTAAGTSGNGRAAEPLSIARLYGAGVHAYFSGDYLRSYDDLTATIEAGSQDPRTHYFRGLAALGLGRLDEAEADFSQGATLEAQTVGDWPVSRSLERVQGYQRLQLERHRARARVATLERARALERARFIENQAAQPDVQRGRRPAGLPSAADGPANPFVEGPDAGLTSPTRPAAPEPMPKPAEPEPAPVIPGAEEGSAAGDAGLQPEMEQPAGESAGGAGESPLDGSPGEPPGDAGAVPGVAPAEGPAAEDPFGDNAPQPGSAGEPMAEDGAAPAVGGE